MRIGLGMGVGMLANIGFPSVSTINASVTSGASSVTASLRGSGGVALDLHAASLAPGLVTTWPDVSGNGRDFAYYAGGGGTQPTAEAANGPNGTPEVLFGTGKYVFRNEALALTAADIFHITKATGASNNPFDLGGAGASLSFYPYADNHVYLSMGSAARPDCGDPTQDLTAWHVLRGTSTPSEYTINVGAQQLYTTGTNTVGWPAAVLLFGTGNGGSGSLNGSSTRLVIFDHKLSAAELTSFKAGLVNEYGALPGL